MKFECLLFALMLVETFVFGFERPRCVQTIKSEICNDTFCTFCAVTVVLPRVRLPLGVFTSRYESSHREAD